MEPQGPEFQDWEVLQEPLTSEDEETSDFVQGTIQPDYFSLDSPEKQCVIAHDTQVSDNQSSIDPAFQTQYPRNFSADSDRADHETFGDFEEKSDVGFPQNGIFPQGVEHMVTENCSSGEVIVESGESGVEKDEILGEESREREGFEEEGEIVVRNVEGERKKSGIVWWKLPMELLRYCVFKGPVWTVSVAAAFMGFAILGRRLYKMKKKKSTALRPNITADDKKISQFMSRAARLNEAFSVVKRVPIIRPSLPVGGVTSWSVVSLR